MIKKQKNKKRKRNPKYVDDNLIFDLKKAITTGIPHYLTSAITYYNQGERCADCGKIYNICNCERCADCDWKRCLCDLEFTTEDYYFKENAGLKYNKLVSKKAKEFAEQILTKEQLKKLYES